MTRLLVALTVTLSATAVVANPIPTLTAVFLNDMWLDGIEQISCTLAGPNTAMREAEGRAVCFWFASEHALGGMKDPWILVPIIEQYADSTFQKRLRWSRDDQVELQGETMRGLAQGTETVFPWGDDGMAVWIYFGVTPGSGERHVLVVNYFRPDEVSPDNE